MANFTITPNMNLIEPVVGVDPGPDWASNLNNSLTIIDSHDHSSGKGVQITPSGLNINSDLPINQNNLTLARSIRLFPQTTPISGAADIGAIYESGVDLYYNDGNGNQVRITQNGAISGTPGSIANLVSPASASYVSSDSTFVFQSGANIPANIDGAAFTFRDLTLNSFGVTVTPITGLASNYTLVLPTLPPQQNFMTLDQSGNISAPWHVDNSTIQVVSNLVQVVPAGITTTQIGPNAVQQSQLYVRNTSATATAGNVALVPNITGSFTSSTVIASATLVTTGRPVQLVIGNGNNSSGLVLQYNLGSGGSANEKAIVTFTINGSNGFSSITQIDFPINATLGTYNPSIPVFNFLDTLQSSATITYTLTVATSSTGTGLSGATVFINDMYFYAYEL